MSTFATDGPADERDARIEELEGRLAALEKVREIAQGLEGRMQHDYQVDDLVLWPKLADALRAVPPEGRQG